MIYGRFGDPVTVLRLATLDDVKQLEQREPGKYDEEAIENESYVVVRQDDGKERLYHQAFMRADEGSREITAAINAAQTFRIGVYPCRGGYRIRELWGAMRYHEGPFADVDEVRNTIAELARLYGGRRFDVNWPTSGATRW